jgi:hypothetical protein
VTDPTPEQHEADPAARPPREGELVVTVRGLHRGFEVDLGHVFVFPKAWSPEQLEAYARRVLAAAQDMSDPAGPEGG